MRTWYTTTYNTDLQCDFCSVEIPANKEFLSRFETSDIACCVEHARKIENMHTKTPVHVTNTSKSGKIPYVCYAIKEAKCQSNICLHLSDNKIFTVVWNSEDCCANPPEFYCATCLLEFTPCGAVN